MSQFPINTTEKQYISDERKSKSLSEAWEALSDQRLEDCVELCRAYLQGDMLDSTAWSYLGSAYQQKGLHSPAVLALQTAIRLGPQNAWMHYALGISYLELDNLSEALNSLRTAVVNSNTNATYLTMLGQCISRILRQNPDNLKLIDEAEKTFRRLVDILPTDYRPHLNLAMLYSDLGRYTESSTEFQIALEISPENPYVLLQKSHSCFLYGKLEDALSTARKSIELSPKSEFTAAYLAAIYANIGDIENAKKYFGISLEVNSDNIHTRLAEAEFRDRLGEKDVIQGVLEKAATLIPTNINFITKLSTFAKTKTEKEVALQKLLSSLGNGGTTHKERAHIHFAVGRIFDSFGEYDEAFEHFQTGNVLRSRWRQFDISEFEHRCHSIKEVFSERPVNLRGGARYDHSPRIIFIVGLPRSGSTLTEEILACHPEVVALGESSSMQKTIKFAPESIRTKDAKHFPFYISNITESDLAILASSYLNACSISRDDKRVFTDKGLINFLNVGIIALIFPNSKFIFCQRDPADMLLSCYTMDFADGNNFSYDLTNCGKYYRVYSDLVAHWSSILGDRIFAVNYERAVCDFESSVRDILEFCGLPWDAKCLDFHNNSRPIFTASYQQVRRPIYTTSSGRWKNYRRHLTPLFESLGDYGRNYFSS